METHIPTKEDVRLRHELRQINADMARLGGLLKIALSKSEADGQITSLIQELSVLKGILLKKINQI